MVVWVIIMGNGMAIASLVLGIIGLVLGWIPFFGAVFIVGALVGLVLGIIYLVKAKDDNTMTAKGLAIAGVILCGLSIIVSLLILIGTIAYFGVLDPSGFVPERVVISLPFSSVGTPVVTQNTVQLTIMNSNEEPITLLRSGSFNSMDCDNGGIMSLKSGDVEITDSAQIKSGESFTITWTCDSNFEKDTLIKANFNIEYVSGTTGLTNSAKGDISFKYQ